MSQRWTFTLFIDEPEDGGTILCEMRDLSDFQYCIGQTEAAPETGRLHLQGYLELTRKISMGELKAQLDYPQIHLERSKGSADDNDKYCTKPESRVMGPWTFGTHLVQGRRSDLAKIADRLGAGASLAEIARDQPGSFIRYHKGLLAYRQTVLGGQQRTWEVDVKVLYGPTGVGKTRWVYDNFPLEEIYSLSDPQAKWWDNYCGHKVVLIDEFKGQIEYTYLLQLLDRYPMQVQTKGGWTNFCPKTIIITSNYHPSNWYLNIADCSPLMRRIKEIRELTA